MLLNVLVQISSIGYRRLGLTEETKEDRDLGQAKLAIDTMNHASHAEQGSRA